MAYTSPKTGAKVNPGKKKKLPSAKPKSKRNVTRKSNLKKVGEALGAVSGIALAKNAGKGTRKKAKTVIHAVKTKIQDSRNRAQIRKRNAVKKAQKKKRTAKGRNTSIIARSIFN